MITIIDGAFSHRATITKDGAHHGIIERGKAYAQQMDPADLRELADRMDEMAETKRKGKKQ